MPGVPARATLLRPPLKWAGGKRWQIPHIRPLWEPHRSRRLVEPFCGGLAVVLGLAPANALLNDANPHLINFYSWLKRGLQTDLPMANDRALYYRHRQRFNALLSDQHHRTREAAALFYFLNRTGYNGLCRFNQTGGFNVPFGRYARIAYTRDFSRYQKAFERWRFTNVDVARVRLQATDFVYADPPYDVPFTQYAAGGFDWEDQVRTAELLSSHPGPVVLANQSTPRIRDLYRQLGYTITELDAPRRISRTGDRTPAREVLAVRNV